jgi:quercetin dioxygenase-like cupin family protein
MTGPELVARLVADGEIDAPDRALHVTVWSNGPRDTYGAHAHGFDKALVAVRGSIAFELPDTDTARHLRAGDRLDLPAGTRHAATVGPDGVDCVEVHLPRGTLAATDVRAGWLDAETGRTRRA